MSDRSFESTHFAIAINETHLIVGLADGRQLSVPIACYPRLLQGSIEERQNWEIFGDGIAIEWSELDEHIELEEWLSARSMTRDG